MPRRPRVRDANLPHHIMSKSIPELLLFRTNRDKEKYRDLIKEASIEFQIDILAYCLMDNHVHMLIHPKGADISKIMRKINNTYAKYYNRVHNRRGHLFQERFKNKSITDENYLIRASTYIHNNVKDLPEYTDKIEQYPYSSLKYYLGKKDKRGLINTGIILKHLDKDYKKSIKSYSVLMEIQTKGEKEFYNKIKRDIENNSEYRNEKQYIKRDLLAEDVLKAVAKVLKIGDYQLVRIKNSRQYSMYRNIAAVSLRALCDLTRREVGGIIGCISQSTVSILTKKGIEEIDKNKGLFSLIVNAL
jgi:REP element-mobilizing transposase RayT